MHNKPMFSRTNSSLLESASNSTWARECNAQRPAAVDSSRTGRCCFAFLFCLTRVRCCARFHTTSCTTDATPNGNKKQSSGCWRPRPPASRSPETWRTTGTGTPPRTLLRHSRAPFASSTGVLLKETCCCNIVVSGFGVFSAYLPFFCVSLRCLWGPAAMVNGEVCFLRAPMNRGHRSREAS